MSYENNSRRRSLIANQDEDDDDQRITLKGQFFDPQKLIKELTKTETIKEFNF